MNGLLFIDDEEGVRRSVARAFRKGPYTVFTAEGGEEGIAFIRENTSGIVMVISDYKMPGLNGLETLSIIGSISPEVTRVILTGYASMETAIQATNEGIDGFLTKPFDNLELRAKVHEINVRKRLRQFVPDQIYREIDSSPDALRPRYDEATILFSDIRGFTRMSQNVPPEVIATYLNDHYFGPMGEIAHEFQGMVDKHIGDSIMLVFGTPVSREDDAVRAVLAAVEMQKKAREIDAWLVQQDGLRQKIGIGISTGNVFSGVLGSLRKKEFTSIGMAVNIAARLQNLAGEGEILISESTFYTISDQKLAETIQFEKLPPVLVKGVEKPIIVYRVRG